MRIVAAFIFGLMVSAAVGQTLKSDQTIKLDWIKPNLVMVAAGVSPEGRALQIQVDKDGYVKCSDDRQSK